MADLDLMHYSIHVHYEIDMLAKLGRKALSLRSQSAYQYAHLCPAHLRAGVDALDGLTGAHTDGHKVLKSEPAKDTAPRNSARNQVAPVAQVDRAAVS
jgi:hypothetical protein